MIEIKKRFTNELIKVVDSLIGADLRRADLSGADLSGADLRLAKIPTSCKWSVSFVDNEIQIGCKKKTIEDWDLFFSDECTDVFETDRDSDAFKRIKAMYNAYRAYKKTMEGNV